MPERGILYVAYGENARSEATLSMATLRQTHQDYPVLLIGEEPLGEADFKFVPNTDPSFRFCKLNADQFSPYEHTLYLDADTRPIGNVEVGFDILVDGWDMVIVPSKGQGSEFLWHIGSKERHNTRIILAGAELQLQGGVFWFAKNERTARFFEVWREEWGEYGGQDQGALLRALHRAPVKLWLLGRPFNGGAVIQHRFGKAAAGPKSRPRSVADIR